MRPFQAVLAQQSAVCNEYDCPLLMIEDRIITVPVKQVICSVSILHECGLSCTFVTRPSQRRVERELIDGDSLQYKHDTKNNLFSLNIYGRNNHS